MSEERKHFTQEQTRDVEAPTDEQRADQNGEHGIQRADPLEHLLETVAGKEKALEQLLNLVQTLDEKGFLRTIGYFASDFEDLVDAGIGKLITPQAFKLLSVGTTLKEAAGAIDAAPLPDIAKALNQFVQGATQAQPTIRVQGLMDVLKVIKDPDIQFALSAIFSGLKSLGKAIRTTDAG